MTRIGLVLGVLAGLLVGCGESIPSPSDADTCRVPAGWTIGYQDCGVPGCVALCGVLPSQGDGHLLPAGCTVEIGTSSTAPATCVSSCDDCH